MKYCELYAITILLGLIMLSCNQIEKKEEFKTPIKKGDIVLIFNDIPLNWKYIRKNGIYSHSGKYEVKYSIDGITPIYYFPKYSKGNDTIIIQNIDEPIEIEHKYKGHDVFSFIAKPLDTLFFSYQEKKPIVQNLNKSSTEVGINYESIIREKVYTDYFSSYTKFSMPCTFFLENFNYSNLKETDSIFKSEHLIKAKEELKREKLILDSLIDEKKISTEYSKFYDLRNKYRKKILEIKKKPYSNFKDFQQNDSLLRFSFYREYINAIVDNGMLKNVKQKKSSNSLIRDPEAMYDSINKNSYMNTGTRRYLSFLWLEKIVNNSSNQKISDYFKLFKSRYGNDTNLIDYLNEKYNLNVTFSGDLLLEDEHGYKTSFDEVLKDNKGKLLYVDFWASWCAPCREAMPYSHKLKEELKNKDVVFVYLALNDNLEKWKKAMLKEGLSGYKNNYFITNSKTSSMIDSLRIETLPKYMIHDKNGKLVHKNAPGPSTEEIRTILDKYLKE